MKHTYEIQKLEKDGKVTIIDKFTAELKEAEREIKTFAGKHPGLYTLCKVEIVEFCLTEKES